MRLNRWAQRAVTLSAIGVTAFVWSGCSGKKQTELVAGITSQVQVPRDFRTVVVNVNGAFGNQFCRAYPVYDGKVRLPRTLGVISGSDPTAPVTITIAGFVEDQGEGLGAFNCLPPAVGNHRDKINDGGGARVLRRARQPYVEGKILYLPMPLRYACYDVDCETSKEPGCSDGSCTCKGGRCTPPDIDQHTLAEYDDDLVFGSSNTCFRPFTNTDDSGNRRPSCLDDGVPPQVVDANKCIYVLPETASAAGLPPYDAGFPVPEPATHGTGLNVRVVFDNVVSEVLDYEGPCPTDGTGAKEGYCTPDPSKPQMFQLAPGLCNANNPVHKITLITASALCPSKTELQPICDDSVQGPPQPTLIDGGTSTDGACGVSTPLKPAQSALYILMDKSSGMRQFVGSQSVLSQVIGLPLSDPVFSNTLVGFNFLPDAATSCTLPSPFGDVTKLPAGLNLTQTVQSQQATIATLLANTQPLPNAPPMYLDAALQTSGAYNALHSLRGSGSTLKNFNRLALMLLIDRDTTSDCGNSLNAIAEAAAARSGPDSIYTYVVMLGNEDLVDASNGVPPTALADQLAIAGDTAVDLGGGAKGSYHVFTNDPNDKTTVIAKANDAIKTVADDLGSCVYEKPDFISTAAHISMLGTGGPIDLTYSTTACQDTDKNKWVFDQGRIRICSAPPSCVAPGCDRNTYPCDSLRATLKAAAFAAEVQGQPPPDLSPQIIQFCDAPPGPAATDGSAAPFDAGAGADSSTGGSDSGIADAGGGG